MKKVPVQWTDELSVGVDIIDKDHQKLFSLFKQLRSLNEEGDRTAAIVDVLSELYDYTDYHFKREEAVMEVCSYPHLNRHRQVHTAFAAGVKRFLDAAADGADEFMVNSLSEFLEDWLKEHIMGMDKDYETWTVGKNNEINEVNLDFEASRK